MTAAALEALVREKLPVLDSLGARLERAEDGQAVLTAEIGPAFLRPGGVVSGPALFTLADAALWIAILSRQPDQLLAVTISLNISFLRPVPPGPVRTEATLLRMGRRVAFGEVRITDAGGALAAQATGSYALADGTSGVRPSSPSSLSSSPSSPSSPSFPSSP